MFYTQILFSGKDEIIWILEILGLMKPFMKPFYSVPNPKKAWFSEKKTLNLENIEIWEKQTNKPVIEFPEFY